VPELACTHYYGEFPWKARVELEYTHLIGEVFPEIGPIHLINHESGHAFFYATHTGSGVMGDLSADPPERPTAGDIASLETWLGNPGEMGAGTFAVGLCQLQVR
jgi:hypothetical protein